jgi:crotonobetainyl-CoA:carnitine CoA-transferase CaiB-like acyl-CoA transferase
VGKADVVIESSRPRALEALGITPQRFLDEAPGRTWISITGYGRSGPNANRVAFGDDAAVAGGLVAWEGPEAPVFCADALADPLSGLFAAFGGLAAMTAGGGILVDVSMRDASAAMRAGPGCSADHRVEAASGGGWRVRHDDVVAPVVRPTQLLATDRG